MKTILYVPNQRKNLPESPGVYRFIDEEGVVLYIGKSVNLKSRVNSYFQFKTEEDQPNKLLRMRRFISFIEITKTPTEFEAEWLEQSLIQKFRPQYNQQMKSNRRHGFLVLEQGKGKWLWKISPLEESGADFKKEASHHLKFKVGPFRNPKSIKDRLDVLYRFQWLNDWSYSPLPIIYKKDDLNTVTMWIKEKLQSVKHFNMWIQLLENKRDVAALDLAFEQAARFQEIIDSLSPVGGALLRQEFFQEESQPFIIEKQGKRRYGYTLLGGQIIRRTWRIDHTTDAQGIRLLRDERLNEGRLEDEIREKEKAHWQIVNLDQAMIVYRAFHRIKNRIIGCCIHE